MDKIMQNKLASNLFWSMNLAMATIYTDTNNAIELFWVINLFLSNVRL